MWGRRITPFCVKFIFFVYIYIYIYIYIYKVLKFLQEIPKSTRTTHFTPFLNHLLQAVTSGKHKDTMKLFSLFSFTMMTIHVNNIHNNGIIIVNLNIMQYRCFLCTYATDMAKVAFFGKTDT